MPAKLAFTSADVEVPGTPKYEKVSIVVRNGRATVRRRSDVLADRPDVAAVRNVSGDPRARLVEFADGSAWTVRRLSGGCGCGAR